MYENESIFLDHVVLLLLLLLFGIVYFRFNSLREVVKSKHKPHFPYFINAIDHVVK